MLNKLSNSYPIDVSFGFQLKLAISFAFFVFLFLYIFQPFQLASLENEIALISLGFAVVTFMSMLFLNALIPYLFPSYFVEENWIVGKEIIWSLSNLWLIGMANYLYFAFYFNSSFQWDSFWWFQFVTLSVGIFPITFVILWKEGRGRSTYDQQAQKLSEEFRKEFIPTPDGKSPLLLESQNKGEQLRLRPDNILFIQAADNYVIVCYLEKTLQKRIIRTSLKQLEKDLGKFSFLFRCHKSYLVNIKRVSSISGNAQGYKLHLFNTDQRVPVSRLYNTSIKDRLSGLRGD